MELKVFSKHQIGSGGDKDSIKEEEVLAWRAIRGISSVEVE